MGSDISLGNSALVCDVERSRGSSLMLSASCGQLLSCLGRKWRPHVEADCDFHSALFRQVHPEMPQPTKSRAGSFRGALWVAVAILAFLILASSLAIAGEGGTSHIMPGANATLVDLPPMSSGGFVKPMFINYQGDASATVPTAAGVVANLNADANTLVLGGGYSLEDTVLGGAHYSVAAFLPYTWLSISGNSAALGGVSIHNSVSGIGDLTVVPVLLGWKSDNVQYDFLLPVYVPTGSYEVGRLGNTGLNYWTIDPIVGVAYSNAKTGLSAAAHLGYAINTENSATHYKSGNILHLDTSVQQIFPLGSGFANIGAEAWYFEQLTCDSGAGATLGCFKGRTAGIGPVLGYIQPIGSEKLLFEFKWLPELETKNRLKGDYLWLKMVYTF